MELLGKNKAYSEQKTLIEEDMKKFEKETKDVQKRLKKIGDTIENAKNILVEKKVEKRRARENYKMKT